MQTVRLGSIGRAERCHHIVCSIASVTPDLSGRLIDITLGHGAHHRIKSLLARNFFIDTIYPDGNGCRA
jgi:hypothetical protein